MAAGSVTSGATKSPSGPSANTSSNTRGTADASVAATAAPLVVAVVTAAAEAAEAAEAADGAFLSATALALGFAGAISCGLSLLVFRRGLPLNLRRRFAVDAAEADASGSSMWRRAKRLLVPNLFGRQNGSSAAP